jgi:hypothetical protein
MAVYAYEISAEHNIYPNITVYDRFKDGVLNGWKVNTNEGYVMYRTTDNTVELDPITGEERPVTYYYTESRLPLTYNWNNFAWVAVPRDSVDENYIFGVGDNEHEVM